MNCSKCNAVLPQGKMFCSQCGHLNEVKLNKLSADVVSKQTTFGNKLQYFSYPLQWYIYSFIFGLPFLWMIIELLFGFDFAFYFHKHVTQIGFIPENILCGLLNIGPIRMPGLLNFAFYGNIFNVALCVELIREVIGSIIGVFSIVSLFKQQLHYKIIIIVTIVLNILLVLSPDIIYLFSYSYSNISGFIHVIGLTIPSCYFILYFRKINV